MTSTEIQDTDGDTLKDGEEIIIRKEYIPLTNQVRVRAIMLSDPRDEYTDHDGIEDHDDTDPLHKGMAGGIVGEMSIVSYHNSSYGIIGGHSFILYQSYVNDQFDFSDFYGVYQSRLNDLEEGEFNSIGRIYREDLLENFEISRFEYITFDVAADGIGGSSSSNSSGSSGNSSFNISGALDNLEGGAWVNWELCMVYACSYEYSPNAAYSLEVTESQLNSMIDCYKSEQGYSIYSNNCALRAVKSWNETFDYNLDAIESGFYTPRKLKESISSLYSDPKSIKEIDVAEILREMKFNI